MPSQSKKQHNFMAMIANNPKKAKQLKVPSSVGAEFLKADKGKKFKAGGEVKKKEGKMFSGSESVKEELLEAKAIKAGKITPMQYAKKERAEPEREKGMKKGGKCYAEGGKVTPEDYNKQKHKTDAYPQFKKGGKVKCMQAGGIAPVVAPAAAPVRQPVVVPQAAPVAVAPRVMKKGGSCHASGGSVTRADGVAQRGKTRGRFI